MDKSLKEARVDAIKGVLFTLALGVGMELGVAIICLVAATLMVFAHVGIDHFLDTGLVSLEHYRAIFDRYFVCWMVIFTFPTIVWILKNLYQEAITYSYQRDIALGLRMHPLAGTKGPLKRKK
ncbi:hypothetical protein [Vibrio europaeus]|uniref:hypothetical protein n=1 Tax=Vibrio europaeus TaxID=300876 RepID=UPI00233F510E|nr:hypothetical protein [Vibrio europaeus]MDC5857434.1 hypothetical protein [Vibrio europaeus]